MSQIKAAPTSGAGAPVSMDSEVKAVSDVLLDHFNKRWGQGAQLPEYEATFLADKLLKMLQNFRRKHG